MTDLLDRLVEAHGGLERWDELQTVTAHLAQGGAVWALKGQPGVLDDVFITASLHEERESHYPFGAPGRQSVFTPERVAIETGDGTVLEALDDPRASFAGHAVATPWTRRGRPSSSPTSSAPRCGLTSTARCHRRARPGSGSAW